MKKRTLIVVCILVVVTAIYLNRAYAHIYQKIEYAHLKSSDDRRVYHFGTATSKPLTYVAVGDSLTAGVGVSSYEQSYPYQLAQKISEQGYQVTLTPYAVPGAKTSDVIHSSLDQIIKIKPDIITLMIGVNDVHGNISKREFKENYETILKRLTTETNAKIYIVNLPYLGGDDLFLPPYELYFDMRTQFFNVVLKQLSATYGLDYIDLYSETLQSAKHDTVYYAEDQFHPSSEGYTLWADIIYEYLNK